MASSIKNLSSLQLSGLSITKKIKIGIVVSEWHSDITEKLYKAALETLVKSGVKSKNIIKKYVPGSFELTLGAQLLAQSKKTDAVICLGCVIKGETPHFDFICQAVSNGITDLNIKFNKPVIFGVLTTNTLQQAKDRSGGKYGNKGVEAAVAAIKMITLKNQKN
jgi:6,7-dimethyl-8-ribityllumazine synthase